MSDLLVEEIQLHLNNKGSVFCSEPRDQFFVFVNRLVTELSYERTERSREPGDL